MWGALLAVATGCNSNVPETASVELTAIQLRLTIVRMATDPFLQRFNLTLNVQGGGCRSSTELFPDTGYAGRRNVYWAARGRVYVVGQYDARVIDPHNCQAVLTEFRHLDRDVIFLGSFDQDQEQHWKYVSALQRPEVPFEKR
ncbi:MAG: hypothetical protein OEV01_01440 [Nitrospira sp.]|nr:hypothetical protein [Nitrospira sp.]MDH4302852.1 hypothetical protein [Nitrospira sp.]MDH5192987.1 hypothetical protein [Nitrospira sp.]